MHLPNSLQIITKHACLRTSGVKTGVFIVLEIGSLTGLQLKLDLVGSSGIADGVAEEALQRIQFANYVRDNCTLLLIPEFCPILKRVRTFSPVIFFKNKKHRKPFKTTHNSYKYENIKGIGFSAFYIILRLRFLLRLQEPPSSF